MKKLIILALFIAVIILIRFTELGNILSFENLQAQKDVLKSYVEANFVTSILAFIGIYIASVAFSIPGATILTLSAGFIFGTLTGLIAVNIGATLGAIAAFLVARYVLGQSLQDKYALQLERFNQEFEKDGYLYLLTLRFIPLFPFFLINFLSGLTTVRLSTFAWTTAVGILPGSFVYIYAGSQLGSINALADIFSKDMLLAFTLLGLFTLVPIIFKKVKERKVKEV